MGRATLRALGHFREVTGHHVELAIHSGGKGGLQMGRAQVSADEMLLGALPADDVTRMEFLGDLASDAQADEPDIELSDSLLEPWRRFLDASDS